VDRLAKLALVPPRDKLDDDTRVVDRLPILIHYDNPQIGLVGSRQRNRSANQEKKEFPHLKVLSHVMGRVFMAGSVVGPALVPASRLQPALLSRKWKTGECRPHTLPTIRTTHIDSLACPVTGARC
jgi:hypothetical protein